MRIAIPALFCFPFAWNIFFHALTFSLYVSWGLKWVSCRQHIYGSCFRIHSASLCLLVGAFNLFTFKVIIDIYVPIAIFLIVWGWFCSYFSSPIFLEYISPFNIYCKAGLVVLNSLNFCLSEKLFISPPILNEILAGYSNLGCRFFHFSTLNMVFQVVMYGCESWTIKKAKLQRIDAFGLWCWRRLLRGPWTARRCIQSILKEISREYSLEGLILKLKLQCFGHLMRTDSLEKTWCWERLKTGGEGDNRGWDGWMA